MSPIFWKNFTSTFSALLAAQSNFFANSFVMHSVEKPNQKKIVSVSLWFWLDGLNGVQASSLSHPVVHVDHPVCSPSPFIPIFTFTITLRSVCRPRAESLHPSTAQLQSLCYNSAPVFSDHLMETCSTFSPNSVIWHGMVNRPHIELSRTLSRVYDIVKYCMFTFRKKRVPLGFFG